MFWVRTLSQSGDVPKHFKANKIIIFKCCNVGYVQYTQKKAIRISTVDMDLLCPRREHWNKSPVKDSTTAKSNCLFINNYSDNQNSNCRSIE